MGGLGKGLHVSSSSQKPYVHWNSSHVLISSGLPFPPSSQINEGLLEGLGHLATHAATECTVMVASTVIIYIFFPGY